MVLRVMAWAVLLSALSVPAQALILPPDPFDATERYALLFSTADGAITQVQARLTRPAGPGELIAELGYQHGHAAHGYPAQYLAVSRPIPPDTLPSGGPTLVTFDFTDAPLPPGAHHRTLTIYLVGPDDPAPQLVAEYPGERLLLRPAGAVVQTDLSAAQTAEAGAVVVGPLTVVRERGRPQTETIRFNVAETNAVYWLYLTNGDAEGQGRVAAAVVTLNGQERFRPAEFNRHVAGLTRQLTVQPGENVLAVTVRSEPGASLTLTVVREDGRVCRALGPHTFVRATGKPVTEEVSFARLPQLSGPFTLHVRNGDETGAHRVDSGEITLNGQAIVIGNDFNEQVTELSRTVTLQALNTLRVQLNGAPGDRLTLEITGFDNVPPSVTITSPAPGTVVTAGPITVTGVVDDPSATVTVNGVVATVAPDGTFTAEGVPLHEGDNVLTVAATDSCGNQGATSVTVRLQTAPVGPELVFCAERFREQIPHPPGPECVDRALGRTYGFVTGVTDETAVTITINGVLLPDGVEVWDQGPVLNGMREGTFFWAFVTIPPPDGEHVYTATATDAQGQPRTASVYFWRDTVAPVVVITAPANNMAVNTSTLAITGTVDDPEATTVRLNFGTRFPVVDGHFTITTALPSFDGISNFSVTAQDLSGNTGSATLRIIRDRTPPALTVTTPLEGAAVNTPTLTVAGTVVDRTVGVPVTVSVNGQPPTALLSSGLTYSGAVTVAQGLNTLEIVATDEAGNTSRLTRTVLLDLGPPSVQLLAPAAGAVLTGMVSVAADAADDVSGIAQIQLLIDGQEVGTQPTAPSTFALDTLQVAAGSRTLAVQAMDRAGNTAEAAITVEVTPQLRAQITAPTDGGTVLYAPILVQGTIANNYGAPEIGITVNGYVAETQGGKFAVDGVTVVSGANNITVTATDGAGITSTATVNVTIPLGVSEPPVQLEMISVNRVAPASVAFDAKIATASPIVSYQIDFEGDGVVDLTGTTWSAITRTYQNTGLYLPTLTVQDAQGTTYTARTVVNIWDAAALDVLLQSKWAAMRNAASTGDLQGVLLSFLPHVRDRYQALFLQIGTALPQALASIEQVHLLAVTDYEAEAEGIRTENGVAYSYPISYQRDAQGFWRFGGF
ncbi:MAG: Ig-like domain-containing protein [Nitrospirota bacterium]